MNDLTSNNSTTFMLQEQQLQDTQQQLQNIQQQLQDTQQQLQDIQQQFQELRPILTVLGLFSRFVRRIKRACLLPIRALLFTSVFFSALFSRRQRPTEHTGKILMLTISNIDIDPRINKVARALADKGYEIDIFCYQNQPGITTVIEEVIYPGIRYVRVPRDPNWKLPTNISIFYQKEFRGIALRRQYDYVHANDLTTLMLGWILAKFRGVPLIYDAHEMWSENVIYNGKDWVPMPGWVRTIMRFYEGFLVRYVDLFITVSDSISEEFQRRYKLAQKPLLLANYPELRLVDGQKEHPSIRELCNLSDDRFITLYLGGVNPLRNIENVIKAHQYLPDKCVFVIRGPGIEYYKPQYEALAKELAIESRIFYLPPVPMDDVIAGLVGANCGIVMLRNICNNFYWFYPNKFFEYMLGGIPVAVSNFPDVKAHVEKEKCGVVFDPDSPESIAKTIQELYENPEEAKLMGQRGQEGIFRDYNWESAIKVLLHEYQRIY